MQNQESIHGADGSPHITQGHGARPANVGGGAQRLGIDHAVVADFRGVQAFETLFVLCPGEFATVHNDTAQAGAVAANVFGQRVHHNVCAMLKRTAQIGAGHGIVHNQRNTVRMCDVGEFFEIGHIAQRVADGFAINGLGFVVDQLGKLLGLAIVGKTHVNAVLRKGVGKQVVRAAVQGGRGHDVVARFGNGLDGIGGGGHAGCYGQSGNAAFHGGDAFFQHVLRGVHDARVNIACHFQVEQVSAMLGVVKGVRGGLVNGHSGCTGGGFAAVATVHGNGFGAVVVGGRRHAWLLTGRVMNRV